MATPKGGFDREFVNDPPKNLECTICLLTLREPHVISCCGNHFCRPCIERVQKDKKPCPLCNDPNFTVLLHKGVMREVNALLVRCPQKELGCKWEGELGYLELHLNPGAGIVHSGCGYTKVECVYKCGAQFLRRQAGDHTCTHPHVEVVIASILKRLDALTAENQAIKAENQQLKVELAANKQEVVQLRGDLEVTQLNEATTPPFIFAMFNYEHYKKVNYTWLSDPFYTHHGGYKMRVRVHPNGFGSGKGTHLKLSVHIMRGENDDKLQWPFRGNVTVQAYNRETEIWDNDLIVTFNDSTRLHHRSKPQRDSISNGGLGHAYISHNDIWQYVAASIIRFRVFKVDL